jgi:hypothetical protein
MRKFGDAIRKPRLPTIGEAIASGQVRHDYEPGETASRMHTDPDCRVCGQPRSQCERVQ